MKDRLNWGPWLYGLGSGFVGGGATAIANGFTNILMDPGTYNLRHPASLFESMSIAFIVAGIISSMLYLAKSPLPALETTTTTEVTTLQQNPPAVVVKTVETKEAK